MNITQENEIYSLLYKKFKLDQFRPYQEAIIHSVIEGNNTLAILQTGTGKSLTYQLPSQYLDGLTIVISPLISLMQDQVTELANLGICSGTINSTTEDQEKQEILTKIYQGTMKIIFLSPEKLIEQQFLNYILNKGIKVPLIVIDEAHCISTWGNGFRTNYLALEKLKFDYNEIPILLLTATATPEVIQDIQNKFIVEDEHTYIGTFLKNNIDYEVIFKEKDTKNQTLGLIKKHENSKGIVYCNTRKEVEELTQYLGENNISCGMYHAGMQTIDRERTQTDYTQNKIDVIVATTAFGMGINIPNIRFVIHFGIPYSVENFYQETGRSGRDGRHSYCYLLFSPKDVTKTRFYLKNDNDSSVLKKFDDITKYVMSNTCRKKSLLQYFQEETSFEKCGHCDVCKRGENILIPNSEEIIKNIITVVQDVCLNERSVGTVRDVLLGNNVKKIKDDGLAKHSSFGIFKGRYSKEMIDYLLYSLVIENILTIDTRHTESYSWEVLSTNDQTPTLSANYQFNQPFYL